MYFVFYKLSVGGLMVTKVKTLLQKVFIEEARKIPSEFKDEYLQEVLLLNIKREKTLSCILIITVAMLLCIEGYASHLWTRDVHIFGRFSVFHGILLILSALFLKYAYPRSAIGREWLSNRMIHSLYIGLIMILCSLIAVRNIWINKQPYTYIIAIFCIASLILLSRAERYLIYSLSYLVYSFGVILKSDSISDQIGKIFFSTLLIILASYGSAINYNSFTNNFIKGKIIINKNNELDNLNKVIEDSLKKRTEELNKIIEYEKLRATFFANISHELRTPLTLIFSAHQMLSLLLKGVKIGDGHKDIEQYMHIIRQNCYRLIRIISNLIDITKIDANFLPLNLENYNIVKVVEDITLSVAKFIQDKGIHITFDTEIEEVIIACDPDKIERVMLNLLSNAVKFTPKGGSINVNICDKGDMIEIYVEDTGIGIPMEMKDLIFERFVQVDGTTSRAREGSGIGLSLVKSLIEMQGGNVLLNSKQGKGSTFIIKLPKRTISNKETERNNQFTSEKSSIEMINIEFSDIYSK
ncbi:MAG: hypothetical protein K0R31_68, partial [Clostridiales bacterium]|nr:hypothetical protein [Clostridiales bacterium]